MIRLLSPLASKVTKDASLVDASTGTVKEGSVRQVHVYFNNIGRNAMAESLFGERRLESVSDWSSR